MVSRISIAALLLLLVALPVSAQPGPFGGFLTFSLADSAGVRIEPGQAGVEVAPVWRPLETPGGVVEFEPNFSADSGRFRYKPFHTPVGGVMPPGFTITVVRGGDTMRVRTPDFSDDLINLGTLPFRAGEYNLPYWFDDLVEAKKEPGVAVEPLELCAFAVGREERLPHATPLLRSRLPLGDFQQVAHDTEKARSEREVEPGEAVWPEKRVGIRTAAQPQWTRWRDHTLTFERTTDGGASWHPLIRAERTVEGGGVALLGRDVLIWWNGTYRQDPILLRSSNGGNTWQAITLDAPVLNKDSGVGGAPFRVAALWVNDGKVLALGTQMLSEDDLAHIVTGEYELQFDLDHTSTRWGELARWIKEEYRKSLE